MFENILVPLDGSERAEAAIVVAADLAKRYQAKIWLFQVRTEPSSFTHYYEPARIAEQVTYFEGLSQKYLSHLAAHWSEQGLSVGFEHVHDHPAEAIVAKATHLQGAMIVMTSHGRDGLLRWLLGSTSEKVVRHAPCPVMIVRSTTEKLPAP